MNNVQIESSQESLLVTRKRSRYECIDGETPLKRRRRLNKMAAERSRAKKKENEEKLIYLAITLQAENTALRSLVSKLKEDLLLLRS
ncbi:9422_t:CDS:2 [Diversispora eburnea]|uniref:9422_t:CDS:1 n=1 Tax=Diversispora eburnea TaxID=1213867 RepID=A0A9N8WBM2_9GLOM|nr:9422_t:CDS:2 [Diversispora eburnea]